MSRWRALRFDFQAMASPCSLQLDGQDERGMRMAAKEAMAEVKRIESKFSRYLYASVISRINQAAGSDWTELDSETDSLMTFADQLWGLSDGLFDATSGVLRKVWDFKGTQLPDPVALSQVLALVGWQHVERKGNQVRLKHVGMELDFGGFGKEYAADRAAAILQRHGIQHALVNLGGDLHALGPRGLPECQGAPWQIAIQHPRADVMQSSASIAHLSLTRGGLATSGDYERYLVHGSKRYCHVLNPVTGWSAQGAQSVSVLATNTTTAGALSTVAMIKGDEGLAWLNSQKASFLLVQHNGQLVTNTVNGADQAPNPS
jgi:thiamine biosynthesis lipoprotein